MNASSPPDSASNANAANIITAYRLASDSMASFFSSISMRADHGSSRCSRLPPQATAASQCSALLVIARLPDSSAACDEMACIPIRTSPAARATTCRPRVFMRTLRQKAAKKSPASSSWAASNTGSCDAAMHKGASRYRQAAPPSSRSSPADFTVSTNQANAESSGSKLIVSLSAIMPLSIARVCLYLIQLKR